MTREYNFVKLDKEQDQVGLNGKPLKVQSKILKEMRGGGELEDTPIDE
jgi:hypothetical protein